MATTNFSVRLDSEVKRQLDDFCAKIGITTNAAISLFANKVVMEKRIPFELADTDAQRQIHERFIDRKLREAEAEAADPSTQWLTQDEVMGKFRERYGL